MGTLHSGDAPASPLPATLSQRQLYPTNNLLPKSVELFLNSNEDPYQSIQQLLFTGGRRSTLELIPIFDRLDEIERPDQLDAILVAMLGQRPLDSAKGG